MWFVELAPLGDPVALPAVVATALGVTPQAGMTVTESLALALSGRRLLIVLDNCEHVLDAAAELVETVLTRTATVTVIATSREALRVRGENSWPVPSLDVGAGVASAAVSLFVERARAVRQDFTLDDVDDVDAVTEICRRLDGIALAIELAAARMVSMSPQEVRDRLDDRFRLLSGSRRGLERHQTLRQAVQWSFDLLTDEERGVLECCSVFADGFELAAISAVYESDGRVRHVGSDGFVGSQVTGDGRPRRRNDPVRHAGDDPSVRRGPARHGGHHRRGPGPPRPVLRRPDDAPLADLGWASATRVTRLGGGRTCQPACLLPLGNRSRRSRRRHGHRRAQRHHELAAAAVRAGRLGRGDLGGSRRGRPGPVAPPLRRRQSLSVRRAPGRRCRVRRSGGEVGARPALRLVRRRLERTPAGARPSLRWTDQSSGGDLH